VKPADGPLPRKGRRAVANGSSLPVRRRTGLIPNANRRLAVFARDYSARFWCRM
jgi:hypothetical protein